MVRIKREQEWQSNDDHDDYYSYGDSDGDN